MTQPPYEPHPIFGAGEPGETPEERRQRLEEERRRQRREERTEAAAEGGGELLFGGDGGGGGDSGGSGGGGGDSGGSGGGGHGGGGGGRGGGRDGGCFGGGGDKGPSGGRGGGDGCGCDVCLISLFSLRMLWIALVSLTRPRGGSPARRLGTAVERYRTEISPKNPPCCNFTPSCSTYGKRALHRHGAVRGSYLTVRRLLRCRPGNGGTDPVPPARER
jgi:putative membrane protein insertion efficiency factor